MQLIHNWTYSLNNYPTSNANQTEENKSYVLALINFLIANGWVPEGSSNGVDVSTTNNITTIADIVMAHNASTLQSWIILKSKEGFVAGLDGSYTGNQSRIWVVFSMEVALAEPLYSAYMKTTYHQEKPTGGTINAAPTSTNQLGYTASDSYRFGSTAWGNNPIYHFAITDKGHFWSAITFKGANKLVYVTAIFPITNVQEYCGSDYPYAIAFYQNYLDTTSSPVLFVTGRLRCWNFNNVGGNAYYVCYKYNVTLALGDSIYGGRVVGGDIVMLTLSIMDSTYGGTITPKLIGDIADFKFTGATSLVKNTDVGGVYRSAYQWFFPCSEAFKL